MDNCKGVLFFCIQYFSLYLLLIFTPFNSPNAVHICIVSTRTQHFFIQSSQWHRKCIVMPLNILSTPIPFEIRNGIIWTQRGIIVYRVMMYANPKTNCTGHVLHFQRSICIVYMTVLGGDFWKYLNREFVFHVTIKIYYFFIVCRIPFSREDVLLQSFIEQSFIVNERFWENWVQFKIHHLPILPIHLYFKRVLHIWCLYGMNTP